MRNLIKCKNITKDLTGILDANGHLTKAEKECCKAKGLCPYCGELPTQHTKECWYQEPASTTGQATLTLEGKPQSATFEEISKC